MDSTPMQSFVLVLPNGKALKGVLQVGVAAVMLEYHKPWPGSHA